DLLHKLQPCRRLLTAAPPLTGKGHVQPHRLLAFSDANDATASPSRPRPSPDQTGSGGGCDWQWNQRDAAKKRDIVEKQRRSGGGEWMRRVFVGALKSQRL
ncbi:hypothetical protein Drorol1_Dr00024634, partial [Drosera rotundifolia]